MKKLESIIKIGIYSVFLLPILFTSRTMYPWHFGKTIIFQIVIEILILLTLFWLAYDKKNRQIKFNKLDLAISFFIIILIITSITGFDFGKSFWGNQQRAQGVFTIIHFFAFYLILKAIFQKKEEWLNLLYWVIFISFSSSVLAWLGNLFNFLPDIMSSSDRLSGMIGNSIFFSSYLILPTFLCFYLFVYFLKKKKAYIFLLIGLFQLITLLSAQTRGSFLGLLSGIVFGFVLYLFLSNNKKIKKKLAIIFLGIILVISSLFIVNTKTDIIKEKAPRLAGNLDISLDARTARTRLLAWQIGYEAWKERPLLGWGAENYQPAFDKYYKPDFLEFSIGETVWDKPHNYLIEILVVSGIFGVLSYLTIWIILILGLFFQAKKSEDEKSKIATTILISGLSAYFVQNLFAFETSNSMHILFFALAFSSYLIFANSNKDKEKDIKEGFILTIFVIFLILIPFLINKNLQFYKASVLMGDARDQRDIGSTYLWQKKANEVLLNKVPFIEEQAIFLTKDLLVLDANNLLDFKLLKDVYPQMEEVFEQEIKKRPDDHQMLLWAGQLNSLMGEYVDASYFEKSNDLLKKAWEINKYRQVTGLIYAKNFLVQKKYSEAVSILRELNQIGGDYSELHWFLGIALISSGQQDEGIKELEAGKDFAYKNGEAINYLIDIHNSRKDYDKIIDIYKHLIKQNPQNASYYASLAATYAAKDDVDNTLYYLNRAVELDPGLAEEAKLFLENNNIKVNNQ